MAERSIGPNVNRLIAEKMGFDAIPPGGGFADGIAFLNDPERYKATAYAARTWVLAAIDAVKIATGNPYGDDDEAIAEELCRRIAARRSGQAS